MKLFNLLKIKNPLTNKDIGNDVFDYLGIEVTKRENKICLHQQGLINKILKETGYNKVKTSTLTPAKESPLEMDINGKIFEANYNYARVVGMLMYLTNT